MLIETRSALPVSFYELLQEDFNDDRDNCKAFHNLQSFSRNYKTYCACELTTSRSTSALTGKKSRGTCPLAPNPKSICLSRAKQRQSFLCDEAEQLKTAHSSPPSSLRLDCHFGRS